MSLTAESHSIEATESKDSLSELISRYGKEKERIVLRQNGTEVMAIVPIEDLQFLEDLEDRIDLEQARRILAEPDVPLPYDQFRKQLGLDE